MALHTQTRAAARLSTRTEPPRPLSQGDLLLIIDSIAEVAPSWSAELTQGFPNESSIVLMPEGADDAIAPTLVLYQDGDAYRLDQFQWDDYTPVAEFKTLRDAVLSIQALLLVFVATTPVSTARH